jgi:hypothetical protein
MQLNRHTTVVVEIASTHQRDEWRDEPTSDEDRALGIEHRLCHGQVGVVPIDEPPSTNASAQHTHRKVGYACIGVAHNCILPTNDTRTSVKTGYQITLSPTNERMNEFEQHTIHESFSPCVSTKNLRLRRLVLRMKQLPSRVSRGSSISASIKQTTRW